LCSVVLRFLCCHWQRFCCFVSVECDVSVCHRLIARSTLRSAPNTMFLDIQREYCVHVGQCCFDFSFAVNYKLITLWSFVVSLYRAYDVHLVWYDDRGIECLLLYCSVLFFWSSNSVTKKYKGHRDVNSLDQFIQEMIEAGAPSELVSGTLSKNESKDYGSWYTISNCRTSHIWQYVFSTAVANSHADPSMCSEHNSMVGLKYINQSLINLHGLNITNIGQVNALFKNSISLHVTIWSYFYICQYYIVF